MMHQLDLLSAAELHRQAGPGTTGSEPAQRPAADAAASPIECGRRAGLPVGLSRRTDPASSAEAAAEYVESGHLGRDCRRVLEALRAHPGSTPRELSERSGIDYYVVQRRLTTLEDAGVARAVAHKAPQHPKYERQREVDPDLAPCSIDHAHRLRWWAK